MQKTISALKVRHNLGQVMNEVALKEDDYIIERAGKPLVAIISLTKYEQLQQEREAVFKTLDQIWEKMKGETPGAVKQIINQAVKAAKQV